MEPEKKSNGATVGLIIILIILIVGGIYVWQSKLNSAMEENQNTPSEDSAELDTLEQDVNNADVNAEIDVNAVQ